MVLRVPRGLRSDDKPVAPKAAASASRSETLYMEGRGEGSAGESGCVPPLLIIGDLLEYPHVYDCAAVVSVVVEV